MFNSIRSIYSTVKSKVRGPKSNTDSFDCTLGARQGKRLSSYLFSKYLNELEYFLRNNGSTGIDIGFMLSKKQLRDCLYYRDMARQQGE